MNCIIVDDEPLAQEVLENYIQRVRGMNLIKKCSNALEAFEVLHKENVDIIFLDVQMPVIDGLGFLKSINNPPPVILTTAFPEHAVASYDFNVTDYLLKPISFERFLKAVHKVSGKQKTIDQEHLTPESSFIFLKVDSKLIKVNYADIMYIEGMKDYLKIYLREKMLVVHHTMKKIEETLPSNQFVRVHKSYIVSLRAVKSIVGNYIDLGEKEIPIGANYKDDLLKKTVKNSK